MDPNASLSITNPDVCIENSATGIVGVGLMISSASSVTLSGETFIGAEHAIFIGKNNSFTLAGLLADGCAIYKDDGTGVARTETKTGPGAFTVKTCDHAGAPATPNNDGTTHSMTCPYCGHTGAAETCAYETWVNQGDGTHKGVCVCGRETALEEHIIIPENWNPAYERTEAGDPVALVCSHPCEKGCGYVKTDGKITLLPELIEIPCGQEHTLTLTSTLPNASYRWTVRGTGEEEQELGTGSSLAVPTDWDVGDHTIYWYVSWDGDGRNPASAPTSIRVIPAALSGKPTSGSGEGKTLGEVEVTLPAGWPAGGTFAWEAGADTQVVRGTSYTYASPDGNYAASGSVVL